MRYDKHSEIPDEGIYLLEDHTWRVKVIPGDRGKEPRIMLFYQSEHVCTTLFCSISEALRVRDALKDIERG